MSILNNRKSNIMEIVYHFFVAGDFTNIQISWTVFPESSQAFVNHTNATVGPGGWMHPVHVPHSGVGVVTSTTRFSKRVTLEF